MWDIARATSGATPPKETLRFWDGGIPWVSPKDMKRRFLDSSEDTVSVAGISEAGLKLIPNPAVLVVVRGMILAHSFPVGVTRVPVTINQDMKALRLRGDVHPEFFAYWLEGTGRNLRAVLVEEAAHGTKAIRMDRWRVTPVEIPPEDEQRGIVAFLDRETARIDALVVKKERLIELLQEKGTALITRAVTKSLDANVPMKDSGVEWLREIPTHWEVRRLKHLSLSKGSGIQMGPFGSMLKELVFSDTGFKLYGQENTISGDFERGSRWLTERQYRELGQYRIHEGDIIVTRKGSIGSARIVPQRTSAGIIDSDTIRVRIDRGSMNPTFVTLLLHEASYVHEQITSGRRGAVLGGLNTATIADLWLAVPPRKEQGWLVARVQDEQAKVDRLMTKVREAIDRLKELRTGLISAAVTGKIDVRSEATV